MRFFIINWESAIMNEPMSMNEKGKIFYASTSHMLSQFSNSTKLKSSSTENSTISGKVRPNSNVSELTNDKIRIKSQQSEINPITQRNLKRQSVEKHYKQAIKYYQPAAEKGDKDAQYKIGSSYMICYKSGEGIIQDDKKAIKYLHMAADQGHAKAQYNLGICYDRGDGVAKDDKQAIKYYQLAAEQGHARAKEALALLQKQKIKNITLGTSVNFYKKANLETERNFSTVEKEKNENENLNYLNYQRVVMCK